MVRYYYLDNQGQLHYNQEDASLANKNNIKIDDIMFYKILDINGKEHFINPYNFKDIQKFKEIALKNALEGRNNFNLAIFEKDANNKSNNLKNNDIRYLKNDFFY